MRYAFTPRDYARSAVAKRRERSEGLAYAARWRAARGLQFVLPAGVKLSEPGQARPTAYTGPYPILSHRTCAELGE